MKCKSGREYIYVLYGAGIEAENFLFQNAEILNNIEFCIDQYHTGFLHNIPIFKLEEVGNLYGKKIIVAAREKVFFEIKAILEEHGLKEFSDFIWSKVYRKKIVLINANCHGDAIIKYLMQSQTFLEEYIIYPFPSIHMNKEKEIPIELLENLEVYIHQDIRANNSIGYKVSDDYVKQFLKIGCKNIVIPNFVGMANWMFPELGGLEKIIKSINGDIYVLYRDKVLDEAVENRCSTLDSYRQFYIKYKYDDRDLEEKWNRNISKLQEREENWDIKITNYILKNYKKIPCFVDHNHPSKYVMIEIGRQVAMMLGLKDIDDSQYESKLGIPIPILPNVKSYFGLDFNVPIEEKETYFDKRVKVPLDDYIRAYIWWYHDKLVI